MSETDISRNIRKALAKIGLWVERVNSGKVPTRGGFFQGASKGTPDTVIVGPPPLDGAWIETKTNEGELNDNQVDWHARAKRSGVRVGVARSVEQAIALVTAWRQKGKRAA
jgi:hypothetical protein